MYARDNGFVSTGNQKVTFQSGAGILSAAATTRFTGTQGGVSLIEYDVVTPAALGADPT
jgi:hypothetical protein